eukprot:scaffold88981_cov32-Tisochrysis_lutea.AAC.5
MIGPAVREGVRPLIVEIECDVRACEFSPSDDAEEEDPCECVRRWPGFGGRELVGDETPPVARGEACAPALPVGLVGEQIVWARSASMAEFGTSEDETLEMAP